MVKRYGRKEMRRHGRRVSGLFIAVRISVFAESDDAHHRATDVPSITKSIVNHVQTSLARQAYNLDNLGAYQAVGLSVRDDLIVRTIVQSNSTSPNSHSTCVYFRPTGMRLHYSILGKRLSVPIISHSNS